MNPRPTRLDGLDLLRGVAVVLVMLRHALPSVFPGAGLVGVVMFFTLSGYLITGVLLAELRRTGRIDFVAFYRRRVARLVPALLALVAAYLLVSLAWNPLGRRDRLWPTVGYALTWTTDLPFAHPSPDLFHLWTLAMEEQFYLLWPPLLLLTWARRRLAAAFVIAGLVAAGACVATLVWLAEAPDLAYALPTSWAGCFVIGGFARYAEGWSRRWLAPRAVLGGIVIGALCVIAWRGHALTYLAGGPAISFATSSLLVTVGARAQLLQRFARLLVALGTVSYAAYLWNYPLTLWGRAALGAGGGLLAVPATLALAALSWRLVEKPARRWILRRGTRAPAEARP